MFYLIKSTVFLAFCLSFLFLSTGCSTFLKKSEPTKDKGSLIDIDGALKNIKDKSYVNSLLKKSINANEGKYLNVGNLYAKFSPDYIAFDDFFKSSLPSKAYRIYMENIDKKIESLKFISSGLKYEKGSIYSKEKISVRKRRVKKEWIWGKKKREKMKSFYKFFRKPGATYEYKIIFKPVRNNMPVSKGEEEKKVRRTNRSMVIFMYQRKKNKEMYIIDPDIFIDSIL